MKKPIILLALILINMVKPMYLDELMNNFIVGQAYIPDPIKAEKGGEDAMYANSNVLAVADGVGGWIRRGVDPALYSRKLVKIIENLTDNGQGKGCHGQTAAIYQQYRRETNP